MMILKPFKYVRRCIEKIYYMQNVYSNKKNDDTTNQPPINNIITDEERMGLKHDNIENLMFEGESEKEIKWGDTIPFVPPVTKGYVIKVYDGDTITIASKLPYDTSPLYRFSVRLNGIDTPEIKGKTEEEKISAKKVQKILEDMILKKTVHLKNVTTEKYGRILF